MCITSQFPTFSQVESTVKEALGERTEYYRNNRLYDNPNKTQVTAFHLRNREAKRSLKVSWNGVDLENTTHPKYLGVTLGRTLTYKQHIHCSTTVCVLILTRRKSPRFIYGTERQRDHLKHHGTELIQRILLTPNT